METNEKLNLEFVKIVQTCYACPSQWDAYTQDGTEYYIRFRHGNLTVTKDGPSGTEVYREQINQTADGFMNETDMLQKIGCSIVSNAIREDLTIL